MTRFDRPQTGSNNLPVELDRATEEFRNSLERQVRAVLEASEARAAQLEREADSYARKARQESEAKAEQILEGTFARASRVLDSIALVENALSGMLDTMRAELASMAPSTLRAEVPESGPSIHELRPAVVLDRASPKRQSDSPATTDPRPDETQPDEPQPDELQPDEPQSDETRRPAEQPERVDLQPAFPKKSKTEKDQPATAPLTSTTNPLQERPDDRSTSQRLPGPESQVAHGSHTTPELDQMRAQVRQMFQDGIRAQVRRMVREGKSRGEVERFLGRIRGGESYLGILDQFYAERSPNDRARTGLLRRLRRRGR